MIATQMIDHLTLVVDDLDRSARFYTEILDFKIIERPTFTLNGRWLGRGPFQIHLNESGPDAGRPGIEVRGAGSRSYAFHVAFRVADIDDALKKARAHGLSIIDGPGD
ncbi:MAG: VOC family protein [Verrucomicrobiota bacterium]